MIKTIMSRLFYLLVLLSLSVEASEMYSRTRVMMGTFVELSSVEKNKQLIQEGFNLLKKVDTSLSSYNKKADIYRLNADRKVTLSEFTLEALLLSKEFYQQSNGYFDITIGSITKDVYKFGMNENIDINMSKLQKSFVNIKGLHVKNYSAYLDEGIKLDLGGMGKGFGVDKVYELFKDNNVSRALIKLSGDIKCISTCSVDITDPFQEERVFANFTTKKKVMAISTSGNYRRYIKNKNYNHLINPKSKHSQREFASITLVSEGLNSELDAMATAIMVMPKEEALRFLDEHNYMYILVDNDKNIYTAKHLDYLIEFKLLYALK